MSIAVAESEQADTGNFDVRTVAADATRASIQVTGQLSAGCVVLLGEVLDGHLRAGRRYARLNLSGVHTIDPTAGAVLLSAHRAFLDRRGTLILTGVGALMRAALAADGLLDNLLVVPPSADEQALPVGP
jgi:anti-anti-sigma regulatory factor